MLRCALFSPLRNVLRRTGILGGIIFLIAGFAAAQSNPPGNASEVLGTWEGESKCTVPDSPCHDEHVIFEIAADKNSPGALKSDGYKVVNGERVFMGSHRCQYNAAKKILSCTARGKEFDDWVYVLSDNTLQGSLTINGKTLYRKIAVKKAPFSAK